MAKQRFGINDGYRGTVGTVIGYMWRGQWCLRARPRFVHNPRTAKQRAARGLFALVSKMASRMCPVLRKGLRAEALKLHRTECNHFMSLNAECFTLTDGQLAVDYERLAVAEGPVAPVGWTAGVSSASAATMPAGSRRSKREEADEGVCITIPFERNPLHLLTNNDDEVYLYAWCPEAGEGLLSAPAYRRSRQVEIALPERWEGMEVHLYGFVTDYAGRASNSTYLGCGTMVETELFSDGHNNNNIYALKEENKYNKLYHETSSNHSLCAGVQRNGDGAEAREGSPGDSQRRQDGGS